MVRQIIGVKQGVGQRKVCDDNDCKEVFYCQKECGWVKADSVNGCYCPVHAKRYNIASPGQPDYCKTRFS